MDLAKKILKTSFASLQVLQYVHDFGSFSVAAVRLGLTQSTVSYTIARLRSIFKDPLFAREGNRVVPTQRCRVIVGHISGLLAEFEGLTSEPDFNPAAAEGAITISCNHYERMTILPEFIPKIRKQAPNLRLRFMTSSALGEDQLKRGECDLLIGPVQLSGDHIFKRHLLSDAYVYVMDADNPLASRPLDLDEIRSAHHLVVQFSGGWQPLYIDALKSHGLSLSPMVELSDYGDIAAYLKGSDLIACMPRRLASTLEPALLCVEVPIPVPLEIDLFWTTRTHHSKLHNWVRQTLAESI
ncbi:LysR family transcriptional regulator [Roseibium album]|uniref:LysR family transcriptional regulator n=1 Tax=Roseibium album TaxID=311410 RepID=UPI0024924380|nr:LysR family transcriptional regulator [Roseibium album]